MLGMETIIVVYQLHKAIFVEVYDMLLDFSPSYPSTLPLLTPPLSISLFVPLTVYLLLHCHVHILTIYVSIIPRIHRCENVCNISSDTDLMYFISLSQGTVRYISA